MATYHLIAEGTTSAVDASGGQTATSVYRVFSVMDEATARGILETDGAVGFIRNESLHPRLSIPLKSYTFSVADRVDTIVTMNYATGGTGSGGDIGGDLDPTDENFRTYRVTTRDFKHQIPKIQLSEMAMDVGRDSETRQWGWTLGPNFEITEPQTIFTWQGSGTQYTVPGGSVALTAQQAISVMDRSGELHQLFGATGPFFRFQPRQIVQIVNGIWTFEYAWVKERDLQYGVVNGTVIDSAGPPIEQQLVPPGSSGSSWWLPGGIGGETGFPLFPPSEAGGPPTLKPAYANIIVGVPKTIAGNALDGPPNPYAGDPIANVPSLVSLVPYPVVPNGHLSLPGVA